MLKLDTKVTINGSSMEGRITGYGFLHRNDPVPVYMVSLHPGFYDPTQTLFISVIVASIDNVKVIADNE